jgi:adenylylsulfate kinase-like enzyme
MSGLSGVDAPYEPPTSPELVVDTAVFTVEQCVDLLQTLVQTLAAP